MDSLSRNNKISIVCPSYNSERYIQRSIDSIINQTDSPDEIIFSDDGSVDDTLKIINNNKRRFFDKKINLVVIKNKHGGPGQARNKGVENSSYNWIAFLDSDDVWMPKKIELVRKEIKKKDTLLITHWEDYFKINGDKTILKHGEHLKPDVALPIQLYKRNHFSTSAVVLNKKIIQKVGGFNKLLPNGQDYDLWLKISPFVETKIIKKSLGIYIQERDSITSRPYYSRIKSNILIAWNHRDKGGYGLFILKLLRIILSKEWLKIFTKFYN